MVTNNQKHAFRFIYHKELIPKDFILDLTLSKSILDDLAKKLNTIHKTSYSNTFWEALLFPNVQLILERLYDRFIFFSSIKIEDLESLKFKNFDNIFLNYDGTEFFSQDDIIEIVIQSKIVDFLRDNSISGTEKLVPKQTIQNNKKSRIIALKDSVKDILRPISYIFLGRLFKGFGDNESKFYLREFIPKAFLDSKSVSEFRSLSKLAKLISARKFFFDLRYKFKLNIKKKFFNIRHSAIELEKVPQIVEPIDKYFFKFLNDNLMYFLPAFCLERFELFNKSLEKIEPQHLITDSASYWDEFSRHIIAKACANKANILVFQHGGGVGLDTKDSMSKIERALCTRFIGWSNLNTDLEAGIIFRKSILDISTKKIILEGQLDQPKTDILIIAPWFKEFHTYNHALHPAEHEKLADILIQLIQDLRRINLNIEYRPYKLKVDRVSQSIKYRFGRIQNIHDQILHSRTIICTTITTHLAECILLNKYPLLIITDRAFNTFTDPVKEILNYLHAENFLFRSSNEIFDSEIFSNCEDFLNRINNPSDKIKNAFHNLIGYNLGSKNEFNRILKSFLKNSYKE